MEGNPDLYGPFWIATTVVVILFLTGTISSYLAHNGKEHFAYDFKLLSGAAGLVYGYTLFIPLGLWAVLKWFGSESANVLECWALYGYANLIWIPVALVSWSPLSGTILSAVDRFDYADVSISPELQLRRRWLCPFRRLSIPESVSHLFTLSTMILD